MEYVEFTSIEKKWMESLQKLLDKQPDTIIGYCTGISINFYKGKELPTIPHTQGKVDGSVECVQVCSKNWEAGAY